MLFAILAFIAATFTIAIFTARQPLLGFPAVIFWALLGGYCYQQSTVLWDLYFLFAFASLLGMTTFCAFGAYAVREKPDTIADEEMEQGEGPYIDETKPQEEFESKRSQAIRGRAEKRRRDGIHHKPHLRSL